MKGLGLRVGGLGLRVKGLGPGMWASTCFVGPSFGPLIGFIGVDRVYKRYARNVGERAHTWPRPPA